MKDTNKTLLDLKKKIDKLKVEFNYTLDDMIEVNNFRAENTMNYVVDDGSASKCDVSEDAIVKYALSIGLIEIEGEKVTEKNLLNLILKHCGNLSGMLLLYYRMVNEYLKKK